MTTMQSDLLENLVQSLLSKRLGFNGISTAVETVVIRCSLQRNNWNQCKSARELGLHRNTISRKMNELQIHPPKRTEEVNIAEYVKAGVWGETR